MQLRSGKKLHYRHPRPQSNPSSSSPLTALQSPEESQNHDLVQAPDTEVSTSLVGSITIQDLPPEMLREIFKWVKCEDNIPAHIRAASNMECLEEPDGVDPRCVNVNEEHPSYKSFRLVCRVWHGVATPLLFRTMILLPHIDSWNKMDHVCTTPHLAQYIRTVQVSTVERLIPDCKGVPSHNDLRELYNRCRAPSLPNGGPLAQLSYDDDSLYERAKYWAEGEEVIFQHCQNKTVPTVRLNLLENLRRVETLGYGDISVIKQRYVIPQQGPAFRALPRRETETMLFDRSEGWREWDEPTHLNLFLAALHHVNAPLHTLTLRNSCEMGKLFGGHNAPSIKSLRRLELNIRDSEDSHMHRAGRNPAYFSQWVREMPDLEELSVIMCPTSITVEVGTMDITSLFSRIRMPKLRDVYLYQAWMTYVMLKEFVQNHRH